MKFILRCLVLLSFVTSVLPAAEPVKPAAGPVLVFVHGAWGGGWQFRKIDPLMQARGYTVYRPTLTGLGERVHLASTSIGLDTHIDDIVNVIRFENLHDVILVGHSYGGMVVTGVADRIPDRISRIIYLDAFLPEEGDSAARLHGDHSAALLAKAGNGFIAPWWVKPGKPYPIDVPHPVKTFTDVIHLSNPAAQKIPRVFVLMVGKGHAAADAEFATDADRAKKHGWPVIQMEGDHNPYWFQPEATAIVLDRACRE